MPFQELAPPPRTAEQTRLMGELAEELRRPRPIGQPRVLVKQVGKKRLRHVYVLWDAWDDVPPPVRGDIVYDAFAEAKGAEYEQSIALVVTATIPEAADLGLLPFQVRFRGRYQPEPELLARCKAAMTALGASTLRNPAEPELRFESEDEAQKAVAELRQAVPGAEWAVTVTVMSPGDHDY
jgi:hypothetical protein